MVIDSRRGVSSDLSAVDSCSCASLNWYPRLASRATCASSADTTVRRGSAQDLAPPSSPASCIHPPPLCLCVSLAPRRGTGKPDPPRGALHGVPAPFRSAFLPARLGPGPAFTSPQSRYFVTANQALVIGTSTRLIHANGASLREGMVAHRPATVPGTRELLGDDDAFRVTLWASAAARARRRGLRHRLQQAAPSSSAKPRNSAALTGAGSYAGNALQRPQALTA